MSNLDRYIRRATAGLPSRTRVDTAAELRVHLNERVEQYVGQGFARDEAEHLAVQQMGPSERVNRSFLGHIFTRRIGWVILDLLMLGIGAWLSRNYLFAPAEEARPYTLSAEELTPLLGDFEAVEVTLPREARTFSFTVSIGSGPQLQGSTNLTQRAADLRPNQRLQVPISIGFPNPGLHQGECPEGARPFRLSDYPGSWSGGCLDVPPTQGSWRHLSADGLEIVYDTWQPLLVYQPHAHVGTLPEGVRSVVQMPDGYVVTAEPETWLVLHIHVSRTSMDDIGPLPPVPSAQDVIDEHFWLARDLYVAPRPQRPASQPSEP